MKTNIKQVVKIIEKSEKKRTDSITVSQDIQEAYNWLPPEALEMVLNELCIPRIDDHSIASFYRAFDLTPRGKHVVTVCLGTACHVRGAPIVPDRIQDILRISPCCTSKDQQFTLGTVNCPGACALAPLVVDNQYNGQTTVQKVDPILNKYLKKRKIKKTTRKK